ncbi:MAG: hypothetical protein VB858_19865 [Planctomycetaceae bacterium]
MTYMLWGSLAIASASIGAIMWYRSTQAQYAFTFLGLSLFAVPALLGAAYLPSVAIGLLLLLGPILHDRLRTARGTSTPSTELLPADSQRLSYYPILLAFVSLLIGGLTFIVGIGAAFNRAGNWSNRFAELGVVLFFLAALSNITAFEAGSLSLIRRKIFHLWLPVSFIGLAVTAYAAWIAVNL